MLLPKATRSLGSGLHSVALMVSWGHVAARAFLISVAGATTWSKDVNQTEQLPGVMSGSMAKLQPVSILKSLTQVATRAHTETLDLGQSLWLVWNLGAMPETK